MSDVGLFQSEGSLLTDFALDGDDLSSDDGLRTAVLLSLFSHGQLDSTSQLPDGVTDMGGWWGDGVPVVEGDRFGSRLWRHDRAKVTPALLPEIETDAKDALQWMLDDKVASSVTAAASILEKRNGYLLAVGIHRDGKEPVSFRFEKAWETELSR